MTLLTVPFTCTQCQNPELEALVVIDTASDPGQYGGLPENCYPGEACEWHPEQPETCLVCGQQYSVDWMFEHLDDEVQRLEADSFEPNWDWDN